MHLHLLPSLCPLLGLPSALLALLLCAGLISMTRPAGFAPRAPTANNKRPTLTLYKTAAICSIFFKACLSSFSFWLGLSACWSHRGTRARVLGLPPPFRPLVLVLGFLSTPRTLNGVAMVDRPHYHPHAPLLLTANLVFFLVIPAKT